MRTTPSKGLMLASSLAVVLALAACDRSDDRITTTGSPDVTEESRDAAARARANADNAGDRVAEESRDAAARARAGTENAADSTRSMGAAAADKVDDATITSKVNAQLASDSDLSALRIDVDTKDGVVTLTGPAPSADARQRAAEIARNVDGVTSVNNQLTVQSS
jgi:hyperosmotically inducible periplasmic protein